MQDVVDPGHRPVLWAPTAHLVSGTEALACLLANRQASKDAPVAPREPFAVQMRAFNRFYTERFGALDARHEGWR